MKINLKSGKQLIALGMGLLVLTWIVVLIGSVLARMDFFRDDGGGIVNLTSVLAVSVFILFHLISIFLVFVGTTLFFLREFSIRNMASMLWGISALTVLGGSTFYIYSFFY